MNRLKRISEKLREKDREGVRKKQKDENVD